MAHLADRAVRDTREWDQAYVRKESEKLIQELSLPCELAEAERAGGGKIRVDGRVLDVKIYEVACHAGTGYFLVSQRPQKPLAVSCFSAEAAHTAGVARDEFNCRLPANKDVRTMAASVMKAAGTACEVSNYRWVGTNAQGNTEYSEVACADGKGYVLEVPQSGPSARISIVGCQDALSEGLKCSLTAVKMPVTLQTFRDALKDHAVNCEPAQLRYIGRESQGRRYVVELQCPQQPQGLVAFIPLEGNPKPFETLDCPAAVARAVQCTLTARQ